jgi:hypothetical protein
VTATSKQILTPLPGKYFLLILVLILLFLFVVLVIYFSEKKEKQVFCLRWYCSLTAAELFKIDILVELGIGLLFPEGKQRSEQD